MKNYKLYILIKIQILMSLSSKILKKPKKIITLKISTLIKVFENLYSKHTPIYKYTNDLIDLT